MRVCVYVHHGEVARRVSDSEDCMVVTWGDAAVKEIMGCCGGSQMLRS